MARMRFLNPARQTITMWTSKKQHKKHGDEEMNRARGLLAAEHSDGGGKRGRDGGRHRQARPDHQGEQNEDHEQVGEPLKHVVGPGFCFIRPLEAQMVRDYSRERPPREIGRRPGAGFSGNALSSRPEITYSKPVNTATQAA